MRYAVVSIIFIACCLLLTACSGSKYWINGLTLPPGSTEVSRTVSDTTPSPILALPEGFKCEKTLAVGFKSPGGWSAVTSHFDACMSQLGYTEGISALSAELGSQAGGLGMMLSGMERMYVKEGSPYVVMLVNPGGGMGFARSQAAASAGKPDAAGNTGTDEYALGIILMGK